MRNQNFGWSIFWCGAAAAFALAVTPIRSWGDDDQKEKVLEVGKWYPNLESGINLTQSSYSDNWAGGDKGSVVWTFITNGALENQLSPQVNWSNVLKLAFGQTHQQGTDMAGRRVWERPEKSTDLIDFETIFRFTLKWPLDPFVSTRFESQFQDASDPYGRTLSLNPMKFRETAGAAKKLIDEEDRSLLSRVGFSFRQSARKLFATPPEEGDRTNTETANDGGVEWITDYKTKILEDRVSWTSKLGFYQPVFYSGTDEFESLTEKQLAAAGLDPDVKDFTTTLDVDWENIFSSQITKVLSVGLYVKWIYDKYDNTVPPVLTEDGELGNAGDVKAAIRKSGQFKQTLSVGLTYRFL